jgi:two-component system phosphate regulon sensor histidine kinase PhoR
LEGAVDDKENNRHFLEIIQEHAERLNSLINDLLELSHIESGEVKLELTILNLHNLTESIMNSFKAQLKKKAIEFKNELPSGLTVKADKNRRTQVLTNLLDNAIKFNKERGWVKIYSENLANKIKIIVEDSGAGIPAKSIPRIFERFYRVDKARSRELGGTGLGLSIIKHIVDLHGGSVGLESVEGQGSKFFFILPK